MVATTVKLDGDLKERIRILASARRRTPHWIMREAIAEYVEREEKCEAFRREFKEAWEERQRTSGSAEEFRMLE